MLIYFFTLSLLSPFLLSSLSAMSRGFPVQNVKNFLDFVTHTRGYLDNKAAKLEPSRPFTRYNSRVCSMAAKMKLGSNPIMGAPKC